MQTNDNLVAHEAVASKEWMRLPSKGRDPIFGLTRAFYYSLIERGEIRSACLRRRGALTGVRLINIESVRNYIERHTEAHGCDG